MNTAHYKIIQNDQHNCGFLVAEILQAVNSFLRNSPVKEFFYYRLSSRDNQEHIIVAIKELTPKQVNDIQSEFNSPDGLEE